MKLLVTALLLGLLVLTACEEPSVNRQNVDGTITKIDIASEAAKDGFNPTNAYVAGFKRGYADCQESK